MTPHVTIGPSDRLALARRLDWRFLLADPRLDRVLVAGTPDRELVAALEAFAGTIVVDPTERADVVVVHAPTAAVVRSAIDRVAPGGSIVIELVGRARPGRTGQLAAASAGDVAERLHHDGFIDVHASWVWPDHASGLEIVPLDRPALIRLSLSRRRSGRRARIKARLLGTAFRLGLGPALLDATTVVGRRPDVNVPESGIPAAPLIDAFVGANRARLGLEGLGVGGTSSLLVTPRFQASAHVVALVVPADGEAPRVVAKVHRLADATRTLEAEAACLGLLADRSPDGTAGVPRLIAHEAMGGHAAIVETALAGRPLDPTEIRRGRDRAVRDVGAWARSLQRPGPPDGADDRWTRLLVPSIAALEHVLADDPTDLALVGRARDTLAPLASAQLPLTIEHGDLSHPNLLRLEDHGAPGPGGRSVRTSRTGRTGAIGAIDWELGEPAGYPLTDFLFFLGYVAVVTGGKDRATAPDEHARRIGAAFFGDDRWAAAAAEAYVDAAGIDRTLILPLLVATWVRALARLTGRLVGEPDLGKGDLGETADGARLRGHRYHAIWRTVVEGAAG